MKASKTEKLLSKIEKVCERRDACYGIPHKNGKPIKKLVKIVKKEIKKEVKRKNQKIKEENEFLKGRLKTYELLSELMEIMSKNIGEAIFNQDENNDNN